MSAEIIQHYRTYLVSITLESILMRNLRNAVKNRLKIPQPAAPPLTVDAIRKQLPDMSPQDRLVTQQLLANEPALKRALADSNKFESMPTETAVKDVVVSLMEAAKSPSELDSSFWQAVRLLIKDTKGRQNISERVDNIPLFVNLFELAKGLEEPLRKPYIYKIGSYIYRLKMLRFDPVNEAEYLDSLVRHGQAITALSYWKSRADRPDVIDSVYWWDIGVLYHLEAKLIAGANTLARQMLDRFGYVSPRTAVALINLHKERQVKQFWLQYLCQAARNPPVSASDNIMHKREELDNEQTMNAFVTLTTGRHWDLAQELVENTTLVHQAKFPLFPLKTKVSFGNLNSLASAMVEQNPDLLTNASFYAFWIYNHLAMGNCEEGKDIVESMSEQGINWNKEEIVKIVSLLLSGKGPKTPEAELGRTLVQQNDMSEIAVIYLNWLARYFPQDIPAFINSIECDLTPELAEKILGTGGHIEYPLFDLCFNHECWKQMWKLIRDENNKPAPREAMRLMIRSENYRHSLNLFETILQAFILRDDPEGALAVLAYMEKAHHLKPNRMLYSSVKAALSGQVKFGKLANGDLPWPKTGALAQPISLNHIAALLGVDLTQASKLAEEWH